MATTPTRTTVTRTTDATAAPLTLFVVHRDQPERCVATCAAFASQGVDLRIVVVDNGSRASALANLRAALADARLAVDVVELHANRGFGPAANVGLRRWLDGDAGEWAAVAPHDALPEPGCLAALLDAVADRPRAGLVSAEFGGGGADGVPVVDRYFGGILRPSRRQPGWEDAGHPHGTLLLARRACLREIGLFDERYFAYCEEADLGVRARAAGWEVGIVWGAVVRNPSIGSAHAVVDYLELRNTLLLVRTHSGWYPATIRLLMAVATTAWLGLRPGRRPPLFAARARRLAIADFLRGRFGAPPASLTGVGG